MWEQLLVMERFDYRAGEKDQGTITLVLDLAETFERVSLPVVWAWTMHFDFPRKVLPEICGFFEHQQRVHFEGCVLGQKWSGSLFRIVFQDALSVVMKVLSASEAEGFRG